MPDDREKVKPKENRIERRTTSNSAPGLDVDHVLEVRNCREAVNCYTDVARANIGSSAATM